MYRTVPNNIRTLCNVQYGSSIEIQDISLKKIATMWCNVKRNYQVNGYEVQEHTHTYVDTFWCTIPVVRIRYFLKYEPTYVYEPCSQELYVPYRKYNLIQYSTWKS